MTKNTRKSGAVKRLQNRLEMATGMRSIHTMPKNGNNTRSKYRMNHPGNYPKWHGQINKVRAQQHFETQLLDFIGRKNEAFGNIPPSTLGEPATKAQRYAAISRRLGDRLMELELKKNKTNKNKEEIETLTKTIKKYAPNLDMKGGNGDEKIDITPIVNMLHKYTGKSKESIRKSIDPFNNSENGGYKINAYRILLKEAIEGWKKSPPSEQKNADGNSLRATARILMPTGVVGYGGGKTRRKQRGGGCGCGGAAAAQPLLPTV